MSRLNAYNNNQRVKKGHHHIPTKLNNTVQLQTTSAPKQTKDNSTPFVNLLFAMFFGAKKGKPTTPPQNNNTQENKRSNRR